LQGEKINGNQCSFIVSVPQRNDELSKERKSASLYFISHLYTNMVLIKIHFGDSDWREFMPEKNL
jgi:hypothetical protein